MWGIEAIPPHSPEGTSGGMEDKVVKYKQRKNIMKNNIQTTNHKPQTTTELFEVLVDGEKFEVEVVIPEKFSCAACGCPNKANINPCKSQGVPHAVHKPVLAPTMPRGEHGILAPMPGNLISYEKNVGDTVKMGDPVVVLEAMKMYNNLYAPCDGVIKSMPFKAGDNVKKFDVLCVIEEMADCR